MKEQLDMLICVEVVGLYNN